MSDPSTVSHPSSMSAEDKAALMASDPSAFEDDDTAAAAGDGGAEGGEGEAGKAGEAAGKDGKTADAAGKDGEPGAGEDGEPAAGAEGAAPAADAGKPGAAVIPKARFDEVIDQRNTAEAIARQQAAELAELRKRLNEVRPPKDFETEYKTLDEKAAADRAEFDAGDIDEDEFNKRERERHLAERALTREEARHEARVSALQNAHDVTQSAVDRTFKEEVEAWSAQNPGFLAIEGNAEILQRAVNSLVAFHGDGISNADLLKKASALAFEKTGYKPPAAEGDSAAPDGEKDASGADPGAARRRQNAERAGAASAAPPAMAGGRGDRGGPGRDIDVRNIKPGTFSKQLSKADQEKLLGEGAL